MAMAEPVDEGDVNCLLELFGGRFDSTEMEYILDKFDGDKREAANYIFTTEPRELRQELTEHIGQWTTVENVKRLRRQTDKMRRAQSGHIETTVRLFACETHDTYWWRRVPKRKMVSTCNKCKKKYKAIPRNREWGIAEFSCTNCGHSFKGWGQLLLVGSPCYKCRSACLPHRIIPPEELKTDEKRTLKHSCLSPDCHNRMAGGQVWYPPGADPIRITCVHPVSRRQNGLPVVVEASTAHVSTGSTVATFLPQSDLYVPEYVVFSPPLATIDED